MDNIQKRWTPYTNAISALGAKKLDFIFRERILVVLTYCLQGELFLVPLAPNATKTRAPGTRHGLCANRLGQGVLHFASFFRSFSDWQKTATGFFLKTGHKPFSKGICQKKDTKKAYRVLYSLAFTLGASGRKSERSDY